MNRMIEIIPKRFGPWAAEAAAAAIRAHKTPYLAPLYQVAARDASATRDVLIVGLSSSLKSVREVSVGGLSRLGAEFVVEVLPLLAAKAKDTREAAAKVLGALAQPSAVEALERALDAEKSADVRLTLDAALRACRANVEATKTTDDAQAVDAQMAEEPQAKTKGPEHWESALAGRKPRLPKWCDPKGLPQLRLADGTELSEAA
jgi:HEAT repeat protein